MGNPFDDGNGEHGQKARVVRPNPKCTGCLHYEGAHTACLQSLSPNECGAGDEPETGYAPIIPDAQAYTDWRHKRGVAYNAPTAQAVTGTKTEGPAYQLQILGDSMVTLSERPDMAKSNDVKKGGAAAAVAMPKTTPQAPKVSDAHPAVQAFKRKQMSAPLSTMAAHKAKTAGGGKIFHASALAEHLGAKPAEIEGHAVQSQHASHFVQKIRAAYGDKTKNLTDGQIRSAYHSKNLLHSEQQEVIKALFVDLIKGGDAGCVVGHTSKGKPIHSHGKGAEAYDEEECREAGDVHDDIADRIQSAMWAQGKGQAHHTTRKYLQGIASHHRNVALDARDRGYKLSQERFEKERKKNAKKDAPPATAMMAPPFARSQGVNLSNNPTDAEIAKAMMAGGGANALTASGMATRPLNVGGVPGTMNLGLPEAEGQVTIPVEKPAERKPNLVVGGVQSAAFDLLHYKP